MKIKTFEDFKKRCAERFDGNPDLIEKDGVFTARLATAEKRTGKRAMQLPVAIDPKTVKAEGQRAQGGDDNVVFSFSSESPVKNWWGEVEILSHHQDDADMSRFSEVGAVLYNHNHDQITGTPERVWLENAKGYCEERFGSTDIAKQARKEVLEDGSNRGISVGFVVHEWVFLPNAETSFRSIQGTENGVWVASQWQALEASHTPVPADASVGVGRSAGIEEPEPEPEERGTEPEPGKTTTTTRTENKPNQEEIIMKKRAKALGLDPETATLDQIIAVERELATTEANTRHEAKIASDSQTRAMGELHSAGDLAEDAIKRGISPGEFALELQSKSRAGTLAQPGSDLSDADKRDINDFSMTRFLAGVTAQLTGSGKLDGFEREMAEEGFKECRDSGLTAEGIVLPAMIVRHLTGAQERTLTAGSATSAGNLIDTTLMSGNFVDALRNTTAIGQMGATFLTGLVGNITIPRQTNVLTATNETETGQTTAEDLTTDLISLSPNRIGCEVEFSKQLLGQVNNPSVEAWNRNEIFSALGLKMDYDALNGDGTSAAMLGLRNILTVKSLGTDGAALDWDKVVALETYASTANALTGNLGYLTNAKVRGDLRTTLKASAAGSSFIWEGTGLASEVAGYKAISSNQVLATTTTGSSSNTSDLFFGNWNDQIIAQWGGIDFVLDPYTKASTAVVRLIGNIWADTDVRHEESFAYYSGVVTG